MDLLLEYESLYKQALTHRSYKKKENPNNERLEFLGDAILGLILAETLYHKFPNEKEGFLTEMRSKAVNRKTLNIIGKKVGLKNLLKHQKNTNYKSIYGDALEALIGAIYLEKGFLKAKEIIITKIINPYLKIEELTNQTISYKSKVLEWGQKNKQKIEFQHVDSFGKDHNKTHKILLYVGGMLKSEGQGVSIKKAEEVAARKTILKL